jgi:hypothetical protein
VKNITDPFKTDITITGIFFSYLYSLFIY